MCDDKIAAKLAKLQKAAQVQSAETISTDGVVCCTVTPKRYAHIALRLELSQYVIQGRNSLFKLPLANNRAWTTAEQFHKSSGTAFTPSNTLDDPPSPHKLYAVKPPDSQADLTTVAPLVMEPRTDVWQLTAMSQAWCNDFLGASTAIHGERTATLRVQGTGKLSCANLSTEAASIATEKQGFMLYTYVLMNLNGKAGIYPINRGVIDANEITPDEYNKRKRLAPDKEQDAHWGSMPLIPGVQKFHALIAEAGGGFELWEVFCDGDRIFPE